MTGGARNYRLGRDDEIAVRRSAESVGCEVMRSAGSLGAADLLVTDGNRRRRYALDVKRNAWAGPAARARMAGVWHGEPSCRPYLVRITIKGGRRSLTFRAVEPDGSMGEPSDRAPWD